MTSEKKLLAMIADVEKQIHKNQAKVAINKLYFISFIEKHRVLLATILVSAFVAIIEQGGWKSVRKNLKRFAKLGFLEAVRKIGIHSL